MSDNRICLTLNQMQTVETYMLSEIDRICRENNIQYSLYAGSVLGAVRHSGPIPWDSDIDIIISIEDENRFMEVFQKELRDPLFVLNYKVDSKYHWLYPRVGIKGTDLRRLHVDVFLYSGLPQDTLKYHEYFTKAKAMLKDYHHKTFIVADNSTLPMNIIRTCYHLLRSARTIGSKKHLYKEFMCYSNMYPLSTSDYTTELGCNRYGERMVFKKTYWTDTIDWRYENLIVRIPKEYDEFLKLMYGNYLELPPLEEREKINNLKFEIGQKTFSWLIDNSIID